MKLLGVAPLAVLILASCNREESAIETDPDSAPADGLQAVSVEAAADSDLVGTWLGSSNVKKRQYHWELTLRKDRRFSLKIAGEALKEADRISGTWKELDNLLVLYAEVSGSYMFPIVSQESGPGYPAMVRRIEQSGIEFRFPCCDWFGYDHVVKTKKVEQDEEPDAGNAPE